MSHTARLATSFSLLTKSSKLSISNQIWGIISHGPMWHACPVSSKSDKWKKFMRLFKFCQGAPLSKAWYYLVPETLFISRALCTKFDIHAIGVPIYQFWVSYFQVCPCDTQCSTNFGHLTHCGLGSSYYYCLVGSAVALFGSLVAMLLYPPLQWSWKRGILVSPRPSIRPSVRLCTESCPLCIFHNTGRIHSFLHISSTYFIFSKINSARKWLTNTALCGHGIMG